MGFYTNLILPQNQHDWVPLQQDWALSFNESIQKKYFYIHVVNILSMSTFFSIPKLFTQSNRHQFNMKIQFNIRTFKFSRTNAVIVKKSQVHKQTHLDFSKSWKGDDLSWKCLETAARRLAHLWETFITSIIFTRFRSIKNHFKPPAE